MGMKRTQGATNDEKLTSEAVFTLPQSGMSSLLKHYKLADKKDMGASSVGRSMKGHGEDTYQCPMNARG